MSLIYMEYELRTKAIIPMPYKFNLIKWLSSTTPDFSDWLLNALLKINNPNIVSTYPQYLFKLSK